MLFSCFCTPQISVSVFCNWILTVSHSSASVHYWPRPVLSAKETIDQKSEYISVNGEAAFSSSQTMW